MEDMLVLYEDPEPIATEERPGSCRPAPGLRGPATRMTGELALAAAALAGYDRALELVGNQAERRYLAEGTHNREWRTGCWTTSRPSWNEPRLGG